MWMIRGIKDLLQYGGTGTNVLRKWTTLTLELISILDAEAVKLI